MFYSGQKTYWETYTLAHLPDDMTVGLVIGTRMLMYFMCGLISKEFSLA